MTTHSLSPPKKKKKIHRRAFALLLLLAAALLLWGSLEALKHHRSSPNILLSGRLHIPPHLVDFTPHHQKLFFILYLSPTAAMPLAVMERPVRYRISPSMRRHGIVESFSIPLQQLHFMQPEAQHSLQQLLISSSPHHPPIISPPSPSPPPVMLTIKVRLDHDGLGGQDTHQDITSAKSSHTLGSQDLSIHLDTLIP